MKTPSNVEIFEGELASFWFDEEGILCANGKSTPRTLQKQMDNYALIRKISKGKKVCFLADATSSVSQDKETRDYSARELPNICIAMAVVSESAMGRFITNLFLSLKEQPIPIRFFGNVDDARIWLRMHLEQHTNMSRAC